MLNILSSWVKQIILIVIFTTVVDFLLPSDKYLRYARVLLGLVVMIAIINPMLAFFHKENFFSESQINYNTQMVNLEEVNKRVENINNINNELIVKQYKNNLISLIKNHINEKSTFEVKDINLKIIEQNEISDFGKIENIYILLKPASGIVKNKESIQKVSVKINGFDTNKIENNVNFANYKNALLELKKYLKEKFDIPEKNIQLQLEGD